MRWINKMLLHTSLLRILLIFFVQTDFVQKTNLVIHNHTHVILHKAILENQQQSTNDDWYWSLSKAVTCQSHLCKHDTCVTMQDQTQQNINVFCFEKLLPVMLTKIFTRMRQENCAFPYFTVASELNWNILMCWPKSYNAMIIGEEGSLFKICHVTQIIAGTSLPPTPFLHFTPLVNPPPWEGTLCFPSLPPSGIYLHPVVSNLGLNAEIKVETGQILSKVTAPTWSHRNIMHISFLSRFFSRLWQKVTLDDTISQDNPLELTLLCTCNLQLIMHHWDKHVLRIKPITWSHGKVTSRDK